MDRPQSPSPFVVKFTARGVSDDELLADLCRVADGLGVSILTREQYGEHGSYHPATIHRRLGGWTAACQQAGLASGRPDLGHTDEAWMSNIIERWVLLGRQPTYGDMRGTRFSPDGYARRYGSWRHALVAFQQWVDVSDAERPQLAAYPMPRRRTGRTANLRLRFAVLQRDGFTCCACGASPSKTPAVLLHVDHVVPYSDGGETVLANLQTLCEPCNLGKSSVHPG